MFWRVFFLLSMVLQIITSIKMKLEYSNMCEDKYYDMTVYMKIRSHIEEQSVTFIDANSTIYKEIGRDTFVHTKIFFSKTRTGNFVQLFVIKQRDMCDYFHVYLGELWNDILTSVAKQKGYCPILPGNYHLENHKLNFQRVTMVTLPEGYVKLHTSIKRKTGEEVLCLDSMVKVRH